MLKKRVLVFLSLLCVLVLVQPISAGAIAAKTGTSNTGTASTNNIMTELPNVTGAIAAKSGTGKATTVSGDKIISELPNVTGAIAAKSGAGKASTSRTDSLTPELPKDDPGDATPPISLQMDYTNSFATILSIDSNTGKAYCAAIFSGYNRLTTKVTIQITLQKRGFLGLWWTNVNSWRGTWYNYLADMEKVENIKKGTYRVKGQFWAYSGFDYETYTLYSGKKKY